MMSIGQIKEALENLAEAEKNLKAHMEIDTSKMDQWERDQWKDRKEELNIYYGHYYNLEIL
jgi:hypothetical protein